MQLLLEAQKHVGLVRSPLYGRYFGPRFDEKRGTRLWLDIVDYIETTTGTRDPQRAFIMELPDEAIQDSTPINPARTELGSAPELDESFITPPGSDGIKAEEEAERDPPRADENRVSEAGSSSSAMDGTIPMTLHASQHGDGDRTEEIPTSLPAPETGEQESIQQSLFDKIGRAHV